MEFLLVKARRGGHWITVTDNNSPLDHHHLLLGKHGKIKAGNIPSKLKGKTLGEIHRHGSHPSRVSSIPSKTTSSGHSNAAHEVASAERAADRQGFSYGSIDRLKKMSPEHFVNYMAQQMMGIIGKDPVAGKRDKNAWVGNSGHREGHYGGSYYKKDKSDEQTRGQLHQKEKGISSHSHSDTVEKVHDMLNIFKDGSKKEEFARKFSKRFGGQPYTHGDASEFVRHYMNRLIKVRFENPSKIVGRIMQEANGG